MKTLNVIVYSILALLLSQCAMEKQGGNRKELTINDQEYFEKPGLNVMAYHDYYPAGHQSGVTIIQNGIRVAANGDVRLSPTQRPYPEHGERKIDREKNTISVDVGYPDSLRDTYQDPRYGPPEIEFMSTVRISGEGDAIRISVDLEEPLPEEYAGRLIFSLELWPGQYFDKTYYMDDQSGLFPRQANGPYNQTTEDNAEILPLAEGKKLVVLPEYENEMITIESLNGNLSLVDGRGQRKLGWFIVQSPLITGVEKNAVEWLINVAHKPDYKYEPVIQVSQVGYHPDQKKIAVIEMDKRESSPGEMSLLRVSREGGYEAVKTGIPDEWGEFLRYNYARYDFTDVIEPGMYRLKYGEVISEPFKIHNEVFKRHVWQPTLEYYLPVQMCHMRINDKVKVWHGLCHDDDALMAPVDHVHFDGYRQGPSTLTGFQPFDPVPGLNVGGWHDAGDYDLRVESQATTTRVLSFAWELFRPENDETIVDQNNKLVEIHVPDGKPDILQQIEHGALTVVGGYKALGRLYRGIIVPTGRQYSLLGDGSVMTDNLIYNPQMDSSQRTATHSGIRDDRWVFTEENPRRQVQVAAGLATAYRSLNGYNDDLANDCIEVARALFETDKETGQPELIDAAAELYLSTREDEYMNFILSHKDLVIENIRRTGPAIARIATEIEDVDFMQDVRQALTDYAEKVNEQVNQTPYGVEYTPDVWGAGWTIQRFGVDQYFLHRAFPDIFPPDQFLNSMNFVLGVHPGRNTSSFVSGVGARSLLVAYGVNRDEWSYIPGGSASGTALIRPDLPELKVWPYFWQQTEYVMGGGATNFMFLVLAAEDMFSDH